MVLENINILGLSSLIIISFIIVYTLVGNYFSKKYYLFWSPLTFISLIYFYYVICAPLILMSVLGDVYYVGVKLTANASVSWIAACLSLVSIQIGFRLYKGSKIRFWKLNFNYNVSLKIGLILFMLGLFIYSIHNGFNFNLISSKNKIEFTNEGNFSMYMGQAVSLLVCASILFVPAIVQKRKYLYLIIPIIISFLVFLSGGFRYRLVYLIIALATFYHLYTNKRVKILYWVFFSSIIYLSMGIIETTRNYGNGLDLDKVAGQTTLDIALTGLNEGKIFFYSGKVIEEVEKKDIYIYFEPFITALLMPIPRKILPSKPDGSYLVEIQNLVMRSSRENPGAAFLHYAEAFFSFGWIGVFINGLLLGILSKFFWINYLKNPKNILTIASIALFNGFTYVMISRGYLAQQFTLYCFYIIIPLWLVKKIYSLRIK